MAAEVDKSPMIAVATRVSFFMESPGVVFKKALDGGKTLTPVLTLQAVFVKERLMAMP
jgi:hypothetical protein